MNTPKKIRRFPDNLPKTPKDHMGGRYRNGIGSEKMAAALGRLVAQWSLLEDTMINVLHVLLGVGELNQPARQIYRASTGVSYRIKLMRSLLETTSQNKDRGPEFDEIIAEFSSLNGIRNDYVHGLWWTHESGKVFLQPEATDDFSFMVRREIDETEIEGVQTRVLTLRKRATSIFTEEMKAFIASISPPSAPDNRDPLPVEKA